MNTQQLAFAANFADLQHNSEYAQQHAQPVRVAFGAPSGSCQSTSLAAAVRA